MCTVRKICLPIRREKGRSLATGKIQKDKDVSVIIGDSIIKDINGWELSNYLEKFEVKFFGGAATKDMGVIHSTDSRTCSK